MNRLNESGAVKLRAMLAFWLVGLVALGLQPWTVRAQDSSKSAIAPPRTATPGYAIRIGGTAPDGTFIEVKVDQQGRLIPINITCNASPTQTCIVNTAVPGGDSALVAATPTIAVKSFNQNWAANAPMWMGPNPVTDDLARVSIQTFNASSTPVRIATPVSSGYSDLFCTITNTGGANGTATVYISGTSLSFPIAPGYTKQVKIAVPDLVANGPVSLGGDAGTTFLFTEILVRRRAP